jgi:ferritin-like protein
VANTPTSPQDTTGRAAEKAAKENAKILADRKEEISLMRQAEEVSLANDVFDPKQPDQPILIDEIESVGVAVNNETVIIRTISDIEDMTYGVGNTYTFKAGVKYSVPRHLAEYLERLGYVWSPGS